MRNDKIKLMLYAFSLSMLASCTGNNSTTPYQNLVETGMASGKRNDSIFFGIYLGMPAKGFFAHCWELNKQGIFTDGKSNTAVMYKLHHNELKYPGSMHFYPEMRENKVAKMSVSFQYDGWAPWNKHLFSDSLLADVYILYKRWYPKGNPFIKVNDKEKGILYVKVDGNRRIIIGAKDDMEVKADYTDLFNESATGN